MPLSTATPVKNIAKKDIKAAKRGFSFVNWILEVKNLTHSYSGNSPFINDAVKDISFTVNEGEIIGIIGHTGSGKSTLVQHLNGLLKPTEGNVLFKDEDIWSDPTQIRKIRSEVGLVFQYPEYQIFEETVYKDIAFGPKNMGLSDEEIDKRVRETAKLVEISDEQLEKLEKECAHRKAVVDALESVEQYLRESIVNLSSTLSQLYALAGTLSQAGMQKNEEE